MTKILSSSVLVLVLCGPALADPAPSAFQIGFKVSSGKDARSYAVRVVERQCGSIQNKTTDGEDEIKVCTVPDGAQTRLELEWNTRENQHEVRSRSSVLVSRGATFDIDEVGVKLTVSVN